MKLKNTYVLHTKRIFTFVVIILTIKISFGFVNAEKSEKKLQNAIYQKNIKSVLFYKKGWELSDPVIELNNRETLQLSFDELGDIPQTYQYTIIHCNSGWEPSGLLDHEYIQGFSTGQLKDYKYSFNTTREYIHYMLDFPNEDMAPKLSGNYILRIFKDFDQENKVLERRFYVVEPAVEVSASAKRPSNIELRDIGQKIDFTISYEGFRISDPYSDIRVVLMQNGRQDNTIRNLKPLFINANELIYTYEKENVFTGGNEFRYFDIKSMRYQAEYVASIDFKPPYYHVRLLPAEDKAFKPYYFINDLNGRYYVDVQEGRDKEVEADYVYVYFSLPVEAPLVEEDVYVLGALTDWGFNETNKMTYNFETHAYELTLLLKQGFYNYMYAILKKGEEKADVSYFEGNHYETENDYAVFVYYSDITMRYEKLIGFYRTNTLSGGQKSE
ncbi:MAG: DUF5103 domain-containing protein [Bacteroidales bacterium]|nr:DUF5103 domain-containing protein [Bacteroidales bacterium]